MSNLLRPPTLRELEKAVEDYKSSGTVSDELLCGFDQNGEFQGYSSNIYGRSNTIGTDPYSRHPLGNLPDLIIPLEQMIRKENGKTIMLGSFHFDEGDNHTPDISEITHIRGDLRLRRSHNPNAPNLESIGGTLSTMGPDVEIHFPQLKYAGAISIRCKNPVELPNLEEVRTDIIIPSASVLQLPKLRKARTVSANRALRIEIPQLVTLSQLGADLAQTIVATKLRKTENGGTTPCAPRFYLPEQSEKKPFVFHPSAKANYEFIKKSASAPRLEI